MSKCSYIAEVLTINNKHISPPVLPAYALTLATHCLCTHTISSRFTLTARLSVVPLTLSNSKRVLASHGWEDVGEGGIQGLGLIELINLGK